MMRPEQSLQRLYQAQRLNELDVHFACFLLSKASQATQLLGLAAAGVSQATAQGHVCLDLRQGLHELFQWLEETPPELPAWRTGLLQSGVVGRPGDYQPLILDEQDRLYLHRYWDYEQRLAQGLLQRAQDRIAGVDRAQLALDLARLFPLQDPGKVNWQKIAAATALLRSLTVISGGPGTGKTTTVTKILALLRNQPGGQALRIALAAPTGKAASRLQQAIRQAKAAAGLPIELSDAITEQTTTVHRLLGVRQGEGEFRHHRNNPLSLDVLILDEASMIDVAMMTKLIEALPVNARLILLGDKDQLASVEAGAVLGDICSPCQATSREFATELAELTDTRVEFGTGSEPEFCDSVVVLRHSYRFASDSPIGLLAAAVNQGDASQAKNLLEQQDWPSVQWSALATVIDQTVQRYLNLFKQVESGAPVEVLFQQLERFRLLCALRQGPTGVEALNQRIAARLQKIGVSSGQEWYPGRPVMVTRNDHPLRLYNGDIGITLSDPARQGALSVVFMHDDRSLRWLAPARLPPHESVFAMTVHKSQGSEFDEVLLLLPEQDAPVLSRELIYTAITRARYGFAIASPVAVFEVAVKRRLVRQSGLVDLLISDSFLTI
jgi:exodeoxyribonuclease V alpha subunit